MRSNTKTRRLCWRIIYFIGFIWLIVYLFHVIYVFDDKIHLCSSLKYRDNDTVKYIFNLDHWRGLMVYDRSYFTGNGTVWCDIPSELREISNAICRMYTGNVCTRLPCPMIYSSFNTLEDIRCIHGGRVMRKTDDQSLEKQSDLLCKRGFSLDLFLKKSANDSYPSIIADALTPLSKELYHDLLNRNFRSCDSIWGFTFNFESIINYPWAADQNNLKLFDITFGYNRLIYDLIPVPWLFNYLEQIKSNSKRLSIENVMTRKKAILSRTNSDIYWTNTSTVSLLCIISILIRSINIYFIE